MAAHFVLLRKLTSLRPQDVAWAAQAQSLLLITQLRLYTAPQGEFVALRACPSSAQTDPANLPRARLLASAVHRAASYGVFRPACLVRAVALCALLERKGIYGAQVRLGVNVTDGAFKAHAWVEYAGTILGDEPWHVRSFVPIAAAAGPSAAATTT
jgi:hypothetical protein